MMPVYQGLGADRLHRGNVVTDDGAQDRKLPVVKHLHTSLALHHPECQFYCALGAMGTRDRTPACLRHAAFVTPIRRFPPWAYPLSRQKSTLGGRWGRSARARRPAGATLPAGTGSRRARRTRVPGDRSPRPACPRPVTSVILLPW